MFEFLFGKKPQIVELDQFDGENSDTYKTFRENNTLKSEVFSDVEMRWYDSQSEGETVVLLPGTTGKADVWYQYYMLLKDTHRVLVPDFPEVNTMEILCDTLNKWLESIQVDQAILVGQSFGGVVAQVYSDRNPKVVSKLILMTSFANTNIVQDKTRKNYEKSLNRFLGALKDLKFENLQKTIFKQVIKGVDVAFVEDKPFWKAYYGNMLLDSTADLLKSIHEIQIDFWKGKQSDTALYKGHTLLIEAKTDASYDREEKKALLKRYPNAEVFEIEGSSNLSHIREIQSILGRIQSF